jgi:hypothetical protein
VVTGTATDTQGFTGTTTVTLNIDMTPPVIAVSAPADMTTVSQAGVTITGSATDALSGTAQVTCGGVAATLSGSSFSCGVTLNVGLNLIVVKATDVAGNASASKLHLSLTGTLSAPQTLTVNPTGVNMLVGNMQRFNATDELGRVRTDATWTISDPTIATITSDSSPTLTAVAAGTVTLTATVGSVANQTAVTVLTGTSIPDGTLLWSAPPPNGFTAQKVVEAEPATGSPDLLTVSRSDNQHWMITGLTSQGQALWTSPWTAATSFNLLQATPDASGGLLLSAWDANGYGGSGTNHIVDLDGPTGTQVWRTDFYGGGNEPQLTVGQDGTVYYTGHLDANTTGLVSLASDTGIAKLVYSPPQGYEIITPCNGKPYDSEAESGAPLTNPVVGADGTLMAAFGVANFYEQSDCNGGWNYSYNHTLYLVQIAPSGAATVTPFHTETTFPIGEWPDLNILDIIPDGGGGSLVSWSQNTTTNGVYNLHVTDVTSAGASDYATTGGTGYSEMVLGDNGLAYVNNGGTVTAFTVGTASAAWTYQAPQGAGMNIIASSAGGGLVVKTTSQGVDTVVRLDPNGQPTTDSWSGNSIQYAYGDMWLAVGSTDAIAAPAVAFSESIWTSPAGNGNGSAGPNLLLVGQTDTGLPQEREVVYWLRKSDRTTALDSNGNPIPYTVFEHQSVPWLASGSADGVSPRLYCSDPNAGFSCNIFEDDISPQGRTVPVTSIQRFSYGLKGQQQYWIRRILRKTSITTYVPISTPNIIVIQPLAQPLIDGWPAPYMGQDSNTLAWPPQ